MNDLDTTDLQSEENSENGYTNQKIITLENSNVNDFALVAKEAQDGISMIEDHVDSILSGLSQNVAVAYAMMYAFCIRSVKLLSDKNEYDAKHCQLDEWDNVKVRADANAYYRPVKWLLRNHTALYPAPKRSNLAAIFRDAGERENPIPPNEFPDEYKRRGGLRTWAGDVSSPMKAVQKCKKRPSGREGIEEENKPPVHSSSRKSAHMSEGVCDGSDPIGAIDDQVQVKNEEDENHLKLTLVFWDLSMLSDDLDTLEGMKGFHGMTGYSHDEVIDFINGAENAAE